MTRDLHRVQLTAAELANLWTQYMNDSMATCFLSHALQHVKDRDARDILEFALGLSRKHIDEIKAFFLEENYPIPRGFSTSDDVNLEAPPLFSDSLMIVYMYVMTLHGLTGYAGAVGNSIREDQRKYFMQCNNETMQLYDKILSVMLEKGIFSKPPNISRPNGIQFVKHQNYLNGWFGKKRPLNAIEITGLCFNTQKTVIKIVLEVAFSQVTHSKELRKYFQRGIKLCRKHVTLFSNILSENHLPSPKSWASEISNSTVSPLSDKIMLYHIVTLITSALGFYGAGLAVCQRRDLAVRYMAMISELGFYAEDGAELLIKNGWMEQPPMATDRDALAVKK